MKLFTLDGGGIILRDGLAVLCDDCPCGVEDTDTGTGTGTGTGADPEEFWWCVGLIDLTTGTADEGFSAGSGTGTGSGLTDLFGTGTGTGAVFGPECLLLTYDEVELLMNRGWTIHAGPFLTLALCLAGCGGGTGTGTGTGTENNLSCETATVVDAADVIAGTVYGPFADASPTERWFKLPSTGARRIVIDVLVTPGGGVETVVYSGACGGLSSLETFLTPGVVGSNCFDEGAPGTDAYARVKCGAPSGTFTVQFLSGACPP